MSRRIHRIEREFDLNVDDYIAHSDESADYNCTSFAAGYTDRWFDPYGYWPDGVPRGEGVAYLVAAYQTEGFAVCSRRDPEDGFEKVAIYADDVGRWTHASRLRPDGWWASKIGGWEDILHRMPENLEGRVYGEILLYMKRVIQ